MKKEVWVDRLTWKAAGWTKTDEKDKGGGQGQAFVVVRNGQSAFLKILKSQNDAERRPRMYREAIALSTYDHLGIPKLIESNADQYDNRDVKLYLVTELIAGPTLREYVDAKGQLSLADTVAITTRLLDIIEYYHSRDGVHRDIKPDNIILRNGVPEDTVLVDFGLAWQPDEADAHATDMLQELGNRFLRLNELAPGSPNKRDIRSDITFVVGILFYALTGQHPSVLEESVTARRPHQRPGMVELIRAIVQDRTLAMLGLFDRGFSPLLGSRFQSVRELSDELNRVMTAKPEPTSEATLADIKRRLEAQGAVQHKLYFAKIIEVVDAVRSVRREIGKEIDNNLTEIETGFSKSESTHSWLNMGFDTPGSSFPRFRPCFDIQIVADEIIVSVFSEDRMGASNMLWRTDVTDSDLGDVFRARVRAIFVEGLRNTFGQ